MVVRGAPKKNKNPPFMSHEFVIQNHADIVSCVAMVVVCGLMVQATTALATVFVIPQYIVDGTGDSPANPALYTNGIKDLAAVFFYTLIVIVIHAIAQDYLIDKATKKLHLSKSKLSKFNESAQVALFAATSVCWLTNIIIKEESITSLSSLWVGYPEQQAQMSFQRKFFFIMQMAYWIHCYPNLYFQKVKREDWASRATYASLHLAVTAAAYTCNLTLLACVLLFLHLSCELLLHAARLLKYAEMEQYAETGFKAYNSYFVVVRLVSVILAIVTILFGLRSAEVQEFSVSTGNYNTPALRILMLAVSCGAQAGLLWAFLSFHLAKRREAEREAKRAVKEEKSKAKSKRSKGSDEEVALLPEVDQNTRRRK